jgi:hypothetical protein
MSETEIGVLKEKMQTKRKAVAEMDTNKIDYIMSIFKTLSTELPDQMLFREDGDTMELKTIDSIGDYFPLELQNSGWNLISSQAEYSGVVSRTCPA